MGQQHDICTSLRIDRILIAPQVVRCVVEAYGLVVVDPVLRKVHISSIFWCKVVLITLVGLPLAAAEYVGF